MLFHKSRVPYIGITGITSPAESDLIARSWAGNSSRKVMIGVLVSSKTLRSEPDQWPNRYPALGDIAGIFSDHTAAFNVIHYSTDEPGSLLDQLLTVSHLCGPSLHGFQLNMAWPSAADLRRFAGQRSGLEIILQLNQEAFRVAGNHQGAVAAKLQREYSGLVDHVLLDLSAGYGRQLDPAWARRQLAEMRDAELDMGQGVAGGLSPESLHLVAPLVKEFPQLSLDAEARLRDAEDNLDPDLGQEYLRTAFAMFDGAITSQPTEKPACA